MKLTDAQKWRRLQRWLRQERRYAKKHMTMTRDQWWDGVFTEAEDTLAMMARLSSPQPRPQKRTRG